MITTVTLNPAIDRTILLQKFNYKSVNRAEESREDLGGKGINVAKVIQALGKDVISIGFLGEDNKSKVIDFFAKEKLISDFIFVNGNTRVNTKIVELNKGITTDINESGFIVNENNLTQLKQLVKDYSKKSEFMIFSGSVPKGLNTSVYKELMDEVKADTKIIFDADGVLLLEGLKASPFLIKPNVHELENAFGRKLKTNKDIVGSARNIIADYKIKFVLVSLGEKGSLLISKDIVLKANPIKVTVKSTVGAGDSMLGGFTYALSEKYDEKTALAYAASCGTLAVTKEGTQSITIEEINEMLNQTTVVDESSEYKEI